jgi:hypothetical protein
VTTRPAVHLSCWSCASYRPRGCALRIRDWPHGGPATCEEFRYEPGADERVAKEPGGPLARPAVLHVRVGR